MEGERRIKRKGWDRVVGERDRLCEPASGVDERSDEPPARDRVDAHAMLARLILCVAYWAVGPP